MQYSSPPTYWVQWIKKNRNSYGIPAWIPDDNISGNDAMYEEFSKTGDIVKSFKPQLEFAL